MASHLPACLVPQGMLNMLVWDDMLVTPSGESSPLVSRVHVFNAFLGPVKTTDVGFYRDEYGYALTNTGKRYCMMHQFKSDRNKQFVDHLWRCVTARDPRHASNARVQARLV